MQNLKENPLMPADVGSDHLCWWIKLRNIGIVSIININFKDVCFDLQGTYVFYTYI